MSTRWKTALRFGILWGVLMMLFSLLFDLQEKSFQEIVSSPIFWIRSVTYTIVGIFPIGYFTYAGKDKT